MKIYTAGDCHECEEVMTWIETNRPDLALEVIHYEEKEEWMAQELSVFPALFEGEELIGYGSDIMKVLAQ